MIEFIRLTAVDPAQVLRLLNEPRNGRHMPLAGQFTPQAAAQWVTDKDGQWDQHGYGPWAVLVEGQFAGWAGFQCEANGADYALVLLPEFWGSGAAITQQALSVGFTELGLEAVLISLPFSRNPTRAVARFGFLPDGEVQYGDAWFQQYRLTRESWLGTTAEPR